MIVSRISSKAQVTLPKAVRQALAASEGDQLIWTLSEDGSVVLRRLRSDLADDDGLDPFGIFDEWRSHADDEAFRDL